MTPPALSVVASLAMLSPKRHVIYCDPDFLKHSRTNIQIGKACGVTLSRRNAVEKIPWHGVLISVQARIRLSRSFDQRSHTYLGYTLTVRGSIGSDDREFLLGVGQGAHAKHHFRIGDIVSGDAPPVADPRLETVEFYKVGNLKVSSREAGKRHRRHRGAVFHRRFRSTGSAVIGDLEHEHIGKSARAAFGDARCPSR